MVKNILFYLGSYAHPYYRDLVNNPPKGYKYISSRADSTDATNIRKQSKLREKLAQNVVLPLIKSFGIVKVVPLKVTNASAVHAAQYLLKTNVPYVSDFEDASVFAWYDYKVLAKKSVQRRIVKALSDPNCRQLLPWTDAAKKSLINSLELPDAVKKKITTVYPCILPKKDITVKKNSAGPVKFLFVGKMFYEKGGMDTLRAFRILSKNHKVELTIISKVPESVKPEFCELAGLRLLENLSQADLEAEYRRADVFVLPTHYDTFGLVYLEAMSYGLPCIGTDNFAVPEIVMHRKTGLVVKNHCSRFDSDFVATGNFFDKGNPLVPACMDPPEWAVKELARSMEVMMDNKIRERMGAAGLREITHGRFSVAHRNAVLMKVYKTLN